MELVESRIINLVSVDGYYEDGSAWFTREQIGSALEYSHPGIAIAKIHNAHKERLDQFSRLTDLVNEVQSYNGYVYSIRGVMEICRWSNQPKADEVMDELYDMAEAVAEKGYYSYMSDEQLLELLKARVAKNEKFLRDAEGNVKEKAALARMTMMQEYGKLRLMYDKLDRREFMSRLEEIYRNCANYDGCFQMYLKEKGKAEQAYNARAAKKVW